MVQALYLWQIQGRNKVDTLLNAVADEVCEIFKKPNNLRR